MLDETDNLQALAQDARRRWRNDPPSVDADAGALPVAPSDALPMALQKALMGGQQDLILTQLPVPSGDLDSMRLFRVPLKLAMALEHHLADLAGALHSVRSLARGRRCGDQAVPVRAPDPVGWAAWRRRSGYAQVIRHRATIIAEVVRSTFAEHVVLEVAAWDTRAG